MTRQEHIELVARAIWESETNIGEWLRDDIWNKKRKNWSHYFPNTTPTDDRDSIFLQKGRDEFYREAEVAIAALERAGAYVGEK